MFIMVSCCLTDKLPAVSLTRSLGKKWKSNCSPGTEDCNQIISHNIIKHARQSTRSLSAGCRRRLQTFQLQICLAFMCLY